jgi:hypothetical protein
VTDDLASHAGPDAPSRLVVVPLRDLWGRMPFMGEDAEAEITGDEELPQGPFGSISFANLGGYRRRGSPSGRAESQRRHRVVRGILTGCATSVPFTAVLASPERTATDKTTAAATCAAHPIPR